jgi:hypothetical protein
MHLPALAFIVYFVLATISTTLSLSIRAPPNGGLGGQKANPPSPTTTSKPPQQQDWRLQWKASRDEEGPNLPDNNGGDFGEHAGHKQKHEHEYEHEHDDHDDGDFKARLKHKADMINNIFPWKREPGETELDAGTQQSPDGAPGRRVVSRDAVVRVLGYGGDMA